MSSKQNNKSQTPDLENNKNQIQDKPKVEILKPHIFMKAIEIKEQILMTDGITNMNPRIKAVMTQPFMTYTDPLFQQILKEIVQGIRYVFQTKNFYSFAITGPTSLAFETAVSNVLEIEDEIIVVVHGVCGERAIAICKSHGFKVIRLEVKEPGELIERDKIISALESNKPKLLYICHGDTSSGSLQPLRGIGALCQQKDCLFMVDVSATLCCCPIPSDVLELDILIAGTEYALGLSPGLSLMSFSTRAVEVIKLRKSENIAYCMNFNLLAQSWGLNEDSKFGYHYTPSISLLYGLRESLAMVHEEGLERVIERHMKFSLNAQKEITKLGLKFLSEEDKQRLTSVLVVRVPPELKVDSVVDYLHKNYNIIISKGIPPIARVWRIGIFGDNACRRSIKLLCTVLDEAIGAAKKNISKTSLIES